MKCSEGKEFHTFNISLDCEYCNRNVMRLVRYPCRANDTYCVSKGTLFHNGMVACKGCENKIHAVYFPCEKGRHHEDRTRVTVSGDRYVLLVMVRNAD